MFKSEALLCIGGIGAEAPSLGPTNAPTADPTREASVAPSSVPTAAPTQGSSFSRSSQATRGAVVELHSMRNAYFDLGFAEAL